jgi:hypothetical protein
MTRPQEIRKEILMQLYASRPLAASAALIARQAKKAGLDYGEAEVKAECSFLHGAEYLQTIRDPSGEMKYAITSQGILSHEES